MTRAQAPGNLVVVLVAIEAAVTWVTTPTKSTNALLVVHAHRIVGVDGGDRLRLPPPAGPGGQEVRVDEPIVEIGSIGCADVIDQADVGAELKRVPAPGSSEVIDPVVHGREIL